MPAVWWPGSRLDARAPAAVAVQALWCSDVGHGGDGDAQHADAVAVVVWAAYLVATHHPGISAVQLQRQLGIERHERAWMMLHKLRRAMVAPERELLKREVEVDEFFLGGFEQGLKGGRQRGRKVMCGVAVEVRGRSSSRLRLAILDDASKPSLSALVTASTEPGAIVRTDGCKGYNGLAELGYDHAPLSQGPNPVSDPP